MKTKAHPWHELGVVGGPADRKTERDNRVPSRLEANGRVGQCPDAGVPDPNTIKR